MPVSKQLFKRLAMVIIATWPVLLFAYENSPQPRPRVAVVVDDLGNQWGSGLEAIDIPFIQTIAIMPGKPYTRRLAEVSHEAGKTVILHVPMANYSGFPMGPMGLDKADGYEQFLVTLNEALDSVPHAQGLSNHMGSLLTQDAEAMGWVMEVLRERDLFFFDSLTIASSQAWRVADVMGLPWSRRHVFLDHEPTQEFIAQQWQRALKRASEQGYVTVITHPYPETLAFFAGLDPDDYTDFEWVPLTEVLRFPEPPPSHFEAPPTRVAQPRSAAHCELMGYPAIEGC